MIIEEGTGSPIDWAAKTAEVEARRLYNELHALGGILYQLVYKLKLYSYTPEPSNYIEVLLSLPGGIYAFFDGLRSAMLSNAEGFIADLDGMLAAKQYDMAVINKVQAWVDAYNVSKGPTLTGLKNKIDGILAADYTVQDGLLVSKIAPAAVKSPDTAPTSQGSAIQQGIDTIVPVMTTGSPSAVPVKSKTPWIIAAAAAGLYLFFNR